jgi:hypothetical protein
MTRRRARDQAAKKAPQVVGGASAVNLHRNDEKVAEAEQRKAMNSKDGAKLVDGHQTMHRFEACLSLKSLKRRPLGGQSKRVYLSRQTAP